MKEKRFTAKKFADEIGKPYSTVALWLKDNRIPEAERRIAQMTVEEIERILQTVAQNQARADEEFSMLLRSQNRYEERLATISDIMRDLADKHLKKAKKTGKKASSK